MSIVFENPGIIDPRCITTAGVNVKDPSRITIGYFGTGLKIAIAVLLRAGQGVVIHAGRQVYTFTSKDIEIRGKQFQLVCMNGVELGFTTEYGKSWELWMAYRELWSNAMDEGGRVYEGEELSDEENLTQVVIDGTEFDEVHRNRDEFLLLDRQPRFKTEEIEVYDGNSQFVFYKGIRAGKVPAGSVSLFTYNIISDMQLTEDRTILYTWEVQNIVVRTVLEATDRRFLRQVLVEDNESMFETKIDYNSPYTSASPDFVEVVDGLKKSHTGKINDNALKKVFHQTRKDIAPTGREITTAEAQLIEKARTFAEDIGFPNRGLEIRVVDQLGEGIYAVAVMREKVMLLSSKLLKSGWLAVAQGIIEESVHLRQGHSDCSRQMQTFLFEQIVKLGQQVTGVEV